MEEVQKYTNKHSDVVIRTEIFSKQANKHSNWMSPGLDGVQRY